MAKKWNPQADQPSKLYTREEGEELNRLMKTVINDWGKLDWFYGLYKKYVDASAPRPIGGCGNCALSIETYFNRLRGWYLENSDKFA